ncbi:histidine--tRNA ligase [Promethearchaeum syntrophicum]|uniref:Histidine--tRNA ligase n=1 Tax=Promethearchaeum syntrophicum TaxID=2594042 RepID=A0A5B9DFR4_9ARCH|nr:histidine--tRNA ligase [Candidatus Prometheoarchaeum syntrophicum]QEE17557.1 Histidine--tRNA ligase [Candidatus Prometheoarchaeum syntrophicum]
MEEKPQKRKRKLNLQKPSGTIDFFPEEMEKRRWLIRTIEDLFRKFGLEQIEIPMYDFFELYKVRSGEKIINDIFTFYDPPKHRVEENPPLYALRPEYTASLVRCYNSTELMYRPKPQKFFYIGPCYRYDEPKKGRYRQFTQAGIEIYGSDTTSADAEMLIVAIELMKKLGIKDYVLRINDLTILRTYLQSNNLELEAQNKIFGIIDRITSSLRKGEIGAIPDFKEQDYIDDYYASMNDLGTDRKIIEKLESFLYLVGTPSKVQKELQKLFKSEPEMLIIIQNSRLPEVCELIEAAGVKKNEYVLDYGISRGLDYYTNTVFEIDVPSLGTEKQVCGGGRYNSLIKEFGGEETPALGFSFGFERLLIALENQGSIKENRPRADVFIGTKEDTRKFGLKIAQKLRNSDLSVEIDINNRSFKNVSSLVDRLKIPFLLFIGPREFESGKFTLKNFITKEQYQEISLKDVVKDIKQYKKNKK